MNELYATIEIKASPVDSFYRARNLYWRVMFPKTARLKNKRNPERTTLLMMLERRIHEAKQFLYQQQVEDFFSNALHP